MTKLQKLSLTCALVIGAATPALANGPAIYPYATSANYCPGGLQPITINGVICCGKPNQSMTYQQATSAPVARRAVPVSAKPKQSAVCPEGEKGCRYE